MTPKSRLNLRNCSLMVPPMRVRQADVLVETTATGALVCDPVLRLVHRLDTRHAHYLHTAATTGELPDDQITRHLLERSILHELPESAESRELPESLGSPDQDPDDDTGMGTGSRTTTGAARTFTRRTVLAASITAGITTLALPEAAAASSTSGTPAPTGDLFLSADETSRELLVMWEPTPGPFSYTWTAFNITSAKTQLATGTGNASFFDIAVYTVPAGVTSVRLEVSSNTTPVVSDFFETTF